MGIRVQSSPEGLRITLRHKTQWLGLLFALLFFWTFALAFSFPLQKLSVDCRRPAAGQAPDCAVTNSHYFGLFVRARTARAVTAADYRSSRSGGGGGASHSSLTSDLVLVPASGDPVGVFGISSNADDGLQREMLGELRGYLAGTEAELRLSRWVVNIFGLIGAPLLVFVLWMTPQLPLPYLFPLFVQVDRPGNRVRGRSVMGKLSSWSVGMQELRSIRLLEGAEAFAVLYPRLSKLLGGLAGLTPAAPPTGRAAPTAFPAAAKLDGSAVYALEFRLADGSTRTVGGAQVPREDFAAARDELHRSLILPG